MNRDGRDVITASLRRQAVGGFSLIEMVVVIVLVGILATLGGLLLGKAFDAYNDSLNVTAVASPGQVALEQMAREIRQIRSQTVGDIPVWTGSVLEFYDTSGHFIRYAQSGTQILFSSDGGVTTEPMTNDTGALAFVYTGKSGQILVPTPGQEGSIANITLTFTATNGTIYRAYQVTVAPRMFQ